MKILRTTLLLIMGAFLFIQPVGAIVSSTHASASTTSIEHQSSSLKKSFKKQQRLAKYENFLTKKGVDLNDPVKKWIWLTIIFAVASIVLGVLKLGTLAYLASAAAGICFIIWLLKYLDVI